MYPSYHHHLSLCFATRPGRELFQVLPESPPGTQAWRALVQSNLQLLPLLLFSGEDCTKSVFQLPLAVGQDAAPAFHVVFALVLVRSDKTDHLPSANAIVAMSSAVFQLTLQTIWICCIIMTTILQESTAILAETQNGVQWLEPLKLLTAKANPAGVNCRSLHLFLSSALSS